MLGSTTSLQRLQAALLLLRRGLLQSIPGILSRAEFAAPGILTQAEFVTAVRRERARSDRMERSFAVLVVGLSDIPANRVGLVPQLLRDLVRETDEVGWFDGARLGLLLPECGREQAHVVAGKIIEGLGDLRQAKVVRVYLHGDPCQLPVTGADTQCDVAPSTWPPIVKEDREGATTEDGRQPVSVYRMTEILATPLPAWKRTMDVVGASTLLMLLSPLMLGVALAVRRSSPGPIIFRQKRAGLGGRPFIFYKYRTMVENAEALKAGLQDRNEASGPVFKIDNDPRITPIGRILRRTSLDELPQLYNVLLGNMTLVGPRPPTLDEVTKYRHWQNHRLDVTGGITCTWQVSGRCTIPFEEWMRMDSRYVRNRSPARDVELLLKTIGAVVSGKGAK